MSRALILASAAWLTVGLGVGIALLTRRLFCIRPLLPASLARLILGALSAARLLVFLLR